MKPTIDKARLMKKAWSIFRNGTPYSHSFPASLRKAWEIEKADAEYIGRKARIAAFEIASTAWSGRGVQTSADVADVATSWTGRGASAYYRDARHGQYLGD